MFDPRRSVWTQAIASELSRVYNERPDEGSDPFVGKLRRQLDGASDEAKLLVAEFVGGPPLTGHAARHC